MNYEMSKTEYMDLDNIISNAELAKVFTVFMTKRHKDNALECYMNIEKGIADFQSFYAKYIDSRGFRAVNIPAHVVNEVRHSGNLSSLRITLKEQMHLEDLPSFFTSNEYREYCFLAMFNKLYPTVASRLKDDESVKQYTSVINKKGYVYAYEVVSIGAEGLLEMGIKKLGHVKRILRLCGSDKSKPKQ